MAKSSRPILVLAEKPSVARDIAKVLGATSAREGFLEGNGYIVTWALGHLVTLAQPHEIRPEWKSWRRDTLPMIPEEWPLTILDKTKTQFKIVKKLLGSCQEVICATDAGREGELIFRYIYQAAGCKKPVRRLWVSSLTTDAIRAGFQNLSPADRYDGLGNAARGRSCADWLIGMNLSRAYALISGEPFFVGRVQTPTLAMVVKRELEIRNFKPEDYYEIHAHFSPCLNSSVKPEDTYKAYYLGEEEDLKDQNPYQAKRLPPDLPAVQELVERIQKGQAKVKSIETKDVKQSPPLLYDLTELQRHANRLFGFSASKTLETAQTLYERHKLISYPRTDSKYLSQSVARTLPRIVTIIRKPYEHNLLESTGTKPLGSRFVNDSEVSDHHAIIPTDVSSERIALLPDERKIYDLVCRRLLSAWQEDYITAITTVLTKVASEPAQDIYRSQGLIVKQLGWKRLEVTTWNREPEDEILPAALKKDLPVQLKEIKPELKKTKAPPRLTEASLLTAMETAGRTLDDKELASVIRESGLGTPATRAGIIETLLARKYIERQSKLLVATDLGIRLIDTVHSSVKSPELTAQWERELSQIQNGKRVLKDFLAALESDLRKRVAEVLSAAPTQRPRTPTFVKQNPELEKKISDQILHFLSLQGAHAAGRIYERVSQNGKEIPRRDFELALKNLNQAGQIFISQESFEKNGKTIVYRKISLAKSETPKNP